MAAFFTTDLPALLDGVAEVITFMVTTFPINVIILLGVVTTLVSVARSFLGGKAKTSRKSR